MSQYLQPNNELEIKDQRKIFEIRNRMTNIPANFTASKGIQTKCECEEIENMEHIYYCKQLNNTEIRVEYGDIYKENVRNMKTVMNRFEKSMKRRKENSHVIQKCDPPVPILLGTGNG